MFPATFLNFGPACSAIFLLWSFGEINQLELSIYLDIYGGYQHESLSEFMDIYAYVEKSSIKVRSHYCFFRVHLRWAASMQR